MLKNISTFFENIVDKNINTSYSVKCRQKHQQKERRNRNG
nr:MAG TPA_asm: hypothetical protein [Caudoviricetes sp.]